MAKSSFSRVLALAVVAASLGGCATVQTGGVQLTERECMARAMYFESNRSSDDGMLAVGTVVMNRLESGKYPNTVCGVVGQHRQFADGALTKAVDKRHWSWAKAERAADAVLAGDRHDGVGEAKFFHTAGYKFPYRNMKYVTLAGGNIFYDKRYPAPGAPPWPSASQFAANHKAAPAISRPIMLARADTGTAGRNEERDPSEAASARRPMVETQKPVALARAEAPAAPTWDEDEDAPVTGAASRAKPPVDGTPAQPLVLARAMTRPVIDRDDDVQAAKAPARSSAPMVAARRQPVVVASLQPAPVPKWQPNEIAATLRAAKGSHIGLAASQPAASAKLVVVLKPASFVRAEKTKTSAVVAAAQPSAKPKPILVAMLSDPKSRIAQQPRSIADLIAMEGQGRRAPR